MVLEKGWTKKDVYLFFLVFYLICLPLNAMNLGALGSALKLVAVFPIFVSVLGEARIKLCLPLGLQLILTGLVAASAFWSISLSASIERIISYALLFFLLLSATMFQFEEKDVKKIKMSLVWGSRLTAVLLLVFGEYYEGRLWLRGIITEDPNYICAYFAFGLIFAVQRLIEKEKLSRRLIGLAELVLYLFLILSTGSRGGTIAVLSAIVVYLITASNRDGAWSKKLLFLAVGIVIFIAVMGSLSEVLLDRFTVENVEDTAGANRFDLWANGWDLFGHSSPFRQILGYGTASIRECFRTFNYHPVSVMHNIFLEMLVELGVIGFLLYTGTTVAFAVYAFKLKDKFSLAVLVCMIVLSLSTSLYTFKPHYNIMMYILICTNTHVAAEREGANLIEDK